MMTLSAASGPMEAIRKGNDSAGEIVVQVRHLRKSFRGKSVLRDTTLEISRGEVFALLGPNGAGKTTLVEILSGFMDFDGGDVVVLGRAPLGAPRGWRDRVGVVPQGTGTFDDVSVMEIVQHFGDFYGDAEDPTALLDLLGMTEFASQRCGSLSGGQKRRVDIALAIVGKPELLFLDEPTTGLDPVARRQLWAAIELLRSRGTTIVLTTHYLDEAEALADRIAILIDGEISLQGSFAEIRREYGSVVELSCGVDNADQSALEQWIVEFVASGLAVSGEVSQQRLRIQTSQPTQIVLALSQRLGITDLVDLSVVKPNLESLYLKLVHQGGLRND